MSDPEIIGTPISNFVRTVRMVCEEKGVPYSLNPVMPHSPEIEEIHPNGLVPGFRHGDVELFESKAIATYIDRTFDGSTLFPDDTTLAIEVEKWVSYCNSVVDRCILREFVVPTLFANKETGPDMELINAALIKIEACCKVLDAAVSKTGHLVGDKFTYADCNLLPMLGALQILPQGKEILGKFPKLSAYFEKHASRESFKATEPQPSA